jgi:hypothetical protein
VSRPGRVVQHRKILRDGPAGRRIKVPDLAHTAGRDRDGPDRTAGKAKEARLLELRAALDFARLWRDTASPNDSLGMLEPIFAQIEGGETTLDVYNARALLADVA